MEKRLTVTEKKSTKVEQRSKTVAKGKFPDTQVSIMVAEVEVIMNVKVVLVVHTMVSKVKDFRLYSIIKKIITLFAIERKYKKADTKTAHTCV